jgi:hypothetical protein
LCGNFLIQSPFWKSHKIVLEMNFQCHYTMNWQTDRLKFG